METAVLDRLLRFFERRRSSKYHHPDENTASTRTKPGSKTTLTRHPRELSRKVTAKIRTFTTETRINTDQHGIYTNHLRPRKRHGLTRHPYGPNPICVGPTIACKIAC
ncbi:hypothetical protein DPMN_194680 [Dreissena polymorpha]|uniref:Uncharacterized protein n=1 Tax=Dreissena polymorpha TaxID=45954 RepID=A0A9D4BCK1_DREPO|nr:hypothetical protein DPMN_194680 [Dreissena polymorpha]